MLHNGTDGCCFFFNFLFFFFFVRVVSTCFKVRHHFYIGFFIHFFQVSNKVCQLFSCFSHSFCSQKTPNIKNSVQFFFISFRCCSRGFRLSRQKKMSDSYLTKRFNERFWTTWGYLALGQFKPPINQGMKTNLIAQPRTNKNPSRLPPPSSYLFKASLSSHYRQPSGFHSQHFVANNQNQQHIFTRVHLETAEATAAGATLAEAGGATTGATESVEEALLLLLLLPVLLLLPPLLPPPDAATGGAPEAGEATVALFRPPVLPEEAPAPVTPFLLVVSTAEAWPPVLPDRWDDDLVSLAINDGLPKLHSALFCSPPVIIIYYLSIVDNGLLADFSLFK